MMIPDAPETGDVVGGNSVYRNAVVSTHFTVLPMVPSLAARSTDQPESFSFPTVAMGIVALGKQLITQILLPNLR